MLLPATTLLFPNPLHAGQAIRLETRTLEIGTLRQDGYGERSFTLPLREPLTLDGVRELFFDGILFELEHSTSVDSFRFTIEFHCEDELLGSNWVGQCLPPNFNLALGLRGRLTLKAPPRSGAPQHVVVRIGIAHVKGNPSDRVTGRVDLMTGAAGLRLHAVQGNIPPLEDGRNQGRQVAVEAQTTRGPGPTEWAERPIVPAVDAAGLKYIWTTRFRSDVPQGWESDVSGVTTQVALFLDDDTRLRLDDTSIGGHGDPLPGVLMENNAILLDFETRRKIAGRRIVALEWRLNQIGPGSITLGNGPVQLQFFYDDRDDDLLNTRFQRADADGDSTVGMSDGIFVLEHLFRGGAPPDCEKGADSNDDGTVNLSDPVWLFRFLFRGGPPPPAPFPNCGVDLTEDGLDCEKRPEACRP